METVEIVIRIPKYVFEDTQRFQEAIAEYVRNGTILPKGHGDLKDVSNLLTVTDYDGENEKTYVLYDEIKYAPIVIKADKTESEENV